MNWIIFAMRKKRLVSYLHNSAFMVRHTSIQTYRHIYYCLYEAHSGLHALQYVVHVSFNTHDVTALFLLQCNVQHYWTYSFWSHLRLWSHHNDLLQNYFTYFSSILLLLMQYNTMITSITTTIMPSKTAITATGTTTFVITPSVPGVEGR